MIDTIPIISTDLNYAKDQYDKRCKRSSDYNDISHEITLYGMIGLAILKFKLDAKKFYRNLVIP